MLDSFICFDDQLKRIGIKLIIKSNSIFNVIAERGEPMILKMSLCKDAAWMTLTLKSQIKYYLVYSMNTLRLALLPLVPSIKISKSDREIHALIKKNKTNNNFYILAKIPCRH